MSDWFLYVVRTRQGTLYTGIATDVARRLAEHGGTGSTGAKYLRARGPLEIAYQVRLDSRSTALRAEHRIKRLPRARKLAILRSQPGSKELLTVLGIGSEK